LRKYIKKAAKNYSTKNSIKGFRPGKAPYKKVEQEIGREKLFQQGYEVAIREKLTDAIIEHKIASIGNPSISLKQAKLDEDLIFEAILSVFPKIKLCNIKEIKVKKPDLKKAKPETKEVETQIDRMRKMRAKLITVNRACKKEDRVEVDFKLFMGGVPVEGGTSKNHPIVLGENEKAFIPGFEDNIIGMKKDDKKKFKLKFPDKYHDKTLEGKEGEFDVKMKLVQVQELPELNDDFVKGLGKFKDTADFKTKIQENIKKEKESKLIAASLDELMLKIIKGSKINIPDVLINQEKNQMLRELETNVSNMGLNLDDYLTQIKTTKEKRLLLAPEHNKTAPILAAIPTQIVETSHFTYCIVS